MIPNNPVEPNNHSALVAIDRKCTLILQALLAQQDLLEALTVQNKPKSLLLPKV